MYTPPQPWTDAIRLTPFSGVQFIDFAFNIDELPRYSREWVERREMQDLREDGRVPLTLHALYDDQHPDHDPRFSLRDDDSSYTINAKRALEPFLGDWTPIPLLRTLPGADHRGRDPLDAGPTNWARVRVVELDEGDQRRSGMTHAVVLAVDTQLAERRENRGYTAPSPADAVDAQEFVFSGRYREIGWFLAYPQMSEHGEEVDYQNWANDWVWDQFRSFKKAQKPGRELTDDDFPNPLEHWARYMSFVELVSGALGEPRVRLIDTLSDHPDHKPVNVDLVLDLGNSRSCAMLIESYPNERTVNLNNSMVLRLRDLASPERSHTGPFESHVEFAAAKFGRDHLSNRSGRGRAFFWPSLVRVGEEATALREAGEGSQAYTGLSSPKRYVWDTEPVNQPWRFQKADYAHDGGEPTVLRAVRRYINDRGDVITQLGADEKTYKLRHPESLKRPARSLTCSRSSLLTFMVAEILCHTLQMINDPQVRRERRSPEAPRVLQSIIMTLPPATPLQEQELIRSRAEAAVRLVWEMYGWTGRDGTPRRPEIRSDWDEASCSHFVYLYGEIVKRFRGKASDFFALAGKPRPLAEPERAPAPGAKPEPSIRIASIDIGGGTTDLMITTYYTQRDTALVPSQNFREGFRIAGDEIVRAVIERLVLPPIEAAMRAAGCQSAAELLEDRVGGDRADMSEQEKQTRRDFVLRVLRPVALGMLGEYEEAGRYDGSAVEVRGFGYFFNEEDGAAPPPAHLVAWLENACGERGGAEFRLDAVEFAISFQTINEAIAHELGQIAGLLCEAVHALDCDMVLLTGRPSRLPGVVDLFAEQLAVPPDRILPMHQYGAGLWYPFRSADNARIDDPKTTVVVGAMLCALSEQQIENFTIFTDRLVMRSTARFIGEMMGDGQILDERILFSDVDLKSGGGEEGELLYYNPTHIGFRQLPVERWAATPLYRLELRPSRGDAPKKPVKVTIVRADVDPADEDASVEEIRISEAGKEYFRIDSLEDADGRPLKRTDMVLALDTLNSRSGYWLDSGILKPVGKA